MKTRAGDYAETLVFNFLKRHSDNVMMSANPFDHEKDIIYNGNYVEVKARTRIFSKPIPNTFAIEENQWPKMDSVDISIFVNIPMTLKEHVSIYWAKDKTGYEINSYNGKNMLRFYHIDKMERIYNITDKEIIREFHGLNFSSYKS